MICSVGQYYPLIPPLLVLNRVLNIIDFSLSTDGSYVPLWYNNDSLHSLTSTTVNVSDQLY